MFEKLTKEAQKHFGVIYIIRNTTNGLIYVGQTVNLKRRIKEYRVTSINKKSMKYSIIEAIVEYGFDNFTFDILDTASSKEELNEKEIYWIKQLKSTKSSIGYNKKTGGKGGLMNKESKERMRESSKQFRHTEKTKIKKSIPIIVYRDGVFERYHGSKAFADVIGLARTNVTRAVKNGLKAKGCYVFYDDKELQDKALEKVMSKKRINKEYIYLLNQIRDDVETIS